VYTTAHRQQLKNVYWKLLYILYTKAHTHIYFRKKHYLEKSKDIPRRASLSLKNTRPQADITDIYNTQTHNKEFRVILPRAED
jgi:hypothetical protein